MPDAPGNLAQASALIGEAGGSTPRGGPSARVFAALDQVDRSQFPSSRRANAAHAAEVVTGLRAAGFEVRALEGAAGAGGF